MKALRLAMVRADRYLIIDLTQTQRIAGSAVAVHVSGYAAPAAD
ncbi:hypothetical protein GCM10023080_025860 [Streptomyces pseudoechinosporeus]